MKGSAKILVVLFLISIVFAQKLILTSDENVEITTASGKPRASST